MPATCLVLLRFTLLLKNASGRLAVPSQLDLAIDSMGQADSPEITLACISSLRRRGVLVLVGSMTCPLPINHGESLHLQLCCSSHCVLYTQVGSLSIVQNSK